MIQFDPPYEDDSLEATLHYLNPHHHSADGRRKLLRKQAFASVVAVMNEVAARQPHIITGVGQGAPVALLCSTPLVVEAACRARTLTASEMYRIRSACCGVVSIVSIMPVLLPHRSLTDELIEAVPEYGFEQPRGCQVLFFTTESKTARPALIGGVARKAGLEPYSFRKNLGDFMVKRSGCCPSPSPYILRTIQDRLASV